MGRSIFCKVLAGAIAIGSLTPSALAQPASLALANRAYAKIPFSSDFNSQEFTLALWLKPTGPGENGGGTLISKSGRPDTGVFLCSWWLGWASPSGKVIGLVVHDYSISAKSVTSTTSIAIGQTAHAALTFDGTTLRLYINGSLDKQEPYGFSGVYFSTEDVMIGAFNANTGYTFNRYDGTLDDVCVWNRALSESEVAGLATCDPSIPESGLVTYIPFTDQSLADWSLLNHPAVAVGAIGFGPQHSSLCPADFNCDNQVDDADFVQFVASYNELVIPPADPKCDLNGDGVVDDADFVIFVLAYDALLCS